MPKLSEAQRQALREMVQLKRCWISVYAGIQHTNRGRAEFVWFGFIRKQPRIRLGTVEVLERRGLVAERGWPFGAADSRYRNLWLTPKGREVAKELEEQDVGTG